MGIAYLRAHITKLDDFKQTFRTEGVGVSAALVSVVIPAFNCETLIAEAIGSVLAQDYKNIEIIVVDDGSTDGTIEVVKGFGSQVQLFQQMNQGAAVARNLGISKASGRYIAFLDADDYWWAGKISAQLKAMEQTGLRMAYSRFIWWKSDSLGTFSAPTEEFARVNNTGLSSAPLVTGWTYADLLLDCIVWTSTVVVEKAVLMEAGLFDPHFRKGQDYELWLRLSRLTEMVGLEQPTALYRIHPGSITFRVADRCYEYEILTAALEKWGEADPVGRKPPGGEVRSRAKRMLFNHGLAHLRYGRPEIAADAFAKLIRQRHLSVKVIVFFLLSHMRRITGRVAR